MIQWPIVSALPDDPVSASFISCKKWGTFCGGLRHWNGEACSADFSPGLVWSEALDWTAMETLADSPVTNKQEQFERWALIKPRP